MGGGESVRRERGGRGKEGWREGGVVGESRRRERGGEGREWEEGEGGRGKEGWRERGVVGESGRRELELPYLMRTIPTTKDISYR